MVNPDPHSRLPRLRRRRKLDIPKLLGRVWPAVAEVDAQTEVFHQRWDAHNESARHRDGPLWVALGDSSTQGVGATVWERGWVHLILERLRSRTGEPWRLVNLSMSGGRFADVADRQIPVLNTMLDEPALVTCVIGSNDLMWRRGTNAIYTDAEHAVRRLPGGTWLSKLNGPGPRPARLNTIFEQGRDVHDLRLFNIWNWPSGAGALAADHVHPNDLGYTYMADRVWAAIEPQLEVTR